MFDYRFTVVAPLSYCEPLAYSIAQRTVPTLVSRFTNPRPPMQNGRTLKEEDVVDRLTTSLERLTVAEQLALS